MRSEIASTLVAIHAPLRASRAERPRQRATELRPTLKECRRNHAPRSKNRGWHPTYHSQNWSATHQQMGQLSDDEDAINTDVAILIFFLLMASSAVLLRPTGRFFITHVPISLSLSF